MKDDCLIDLHLHIDGAMSVDTAIKLAEMSGVKLPTYDRAELLTYLRVSEDCADLNEFLKCFDLPCSLMMTEKTVSEAVYRLCEELLAEGLIYAELRFAPQLHTAKGLTQEQAVRAAIDGMSRSSLPTNLILCCMRTDAPESINMETVRLAAEYKEKGVVAVDLAGAEALYPTKNFASVFKYARELCVPFTIHAGEAAGADSVRDAIEMGARRIGHGIRSVEDPSVVELLCRRNIPLEICITSNLLTKAADGIEDQSLRRLMDSGVAVTLNTDDPSVCGTDMHREISLAKSVFGFSDSEIKRCLLNSAEYSFADDETKKMMISRINKAFG